MRAGDRLGGRFELVSVAGEGAMGVVWRARDLSTGGDAAVKLLSGSGADVARFRRESQVLASLQHDAIVGWLGHGDLDGGAPWLAMEWLEGQELAQVLKRGPLAPDAVVTLAHRLLDGLEAAHQAGVVHRDLKPANVVLPGGEVALAKLVDFGIARPSEENARLTRTGMILGTPAYMAPEQVRGVMTLDGRTDLYALGAVLFECLTGRPPWVGDQVMAVLARILLEPAPHAAQVNRDVPPWLDEAVARLMEREVADRPSSAARAHALFARQAEPQAAPPPQLTHQEQRLVGVIAAQLSRRDDGLADTLSPIEGAQIDEHALELVRAHGGRAERLADGSVFAVFTASAATDTAAQAARRALALRQALPGVRLALAMGRGVSGAAVPLGEAVDAAVAALASPSSLGPGVPIDALTRGLLAERFELHEVRGRSIVTGERSGGVAEARLLLGKASPFVGRARELSVLEGLAAESAEEGVARAALVLASAGMGKSRLRRELEQRLRTLPRPPRVLVAHAVQNQADAPLALAALLVRGAAPKGLDAHLAMVAPDEELARLRTFLGELVGAPSGHDANGLLKAARSDAAVMGDQLRRAFVDWLGFMAAQGPLVVLLDDVHWADAASLEWLDAALRALEHRPWCLLAFGRPELRTRFPTLWANHPLEELRLAALSSRAAEQLAREVLGEAAAPAVVARVVETASGNAFYLEELLRAVAQGASDLPATVKAMAQSRLEALDADDRKLLRAASVVGEVFWTGAVREMSGQADAAERLQQLARQEVLVQRPSSQVDGEQEFAFRHALLRDAADGMLTDDDRKVGHRLAAQWLLAHRAAAPAVLARHFELGERPADAATWWGAATADALAANDFDGVLQAAKAGHANAPPPELTCRLLLAEAEALRWNDRAPDAQLRLERLWALVEPGSVTWLRAAALGAYVAGTRRDVKEMVRLGQALLSVPQTDANAAPWVVAAGRIGTALEVNGQSALAAALVDRAQPWLERAQAQEPASPGWLYEALSFRRRSPGNADEDLLAKAIATFEAAGDLRNGCALRANVVFGLLFRGYVEDAAEKARGLLARTERLGLARLTNSVQLLLLMQCALRRPLEETLEAAKKCAGLLQSIEARNVAMYSGSITYAYLRHGKFLEAEAAARAGIAQLGRIGQAQLTLSGLLARALLGQGRAEEALALVPVETGSEPSFVPVIMGRPHRLLVRAECLDALGQAAERDLTLAALQQEIRQVAGRFGGDIDRWQEIDPLGDAAFRRLTGRA
ncbi:MAG: protein kinase [Myxococcaceae bacterium]|nr:protein kinase [Myxococcaceae bacterium]